MVRLGQGRSTADGADGFVDVDGFVIRNLLWSPSRLLIQGFLDVLCTFALTARAGRGKSVAWEVQERVPDRGLLADGGGWVTTQKGEQAANQSWG